MYTVKAHYDGKVFVPLEPIKPRAIRKAFVVIEDKVKIEKEDWSPLSEEERIKRAESELREKFPQGPLSKKWLKMVGTWPELTDKEIKEDLYNVLQERI